MKVKLLREGEDKYEINIFCLKLIYSINLYPK